MKEIVDPGSGEEFRIVKVEWEGDVRVSDVDALQLKKLKNKVVMPKERLIAVPDGEYHFGFKHAGIMNKDVKNIVVDFFEYPPRGGAIAHSHDCEQVFYVVSGRSIWNIDGEEHIVEPGSFIFLPNNTVHGYKALDQLDMLCIAEKWTATGHIIYPKLSDSEIKDKTTLDFETLEYKTKHTR